MASALVKHEINFACVPSQGFPSDVEKLGGILSSSHALHNDDIAEDLVETVAPNGEGVHLLSTVVAEAISANPLLPSTHDSPRHFTDPKPFALDHTESSSDVGIDAIDVTIKTGAEADTAFFYNKNHALSTEVDYSAACGCNSDQSLHDTTTDQT